jgi:methionine-rich copper-binding protein CopC
LPDQAASELLAAWRDAEHALERTTDPRRRSELETLVESIRLEYNRSVEEGDTSAHMTNPSTPEEDTRR